MQLPPTYLNPRHILKCVWVCGQTIFGNGVIEPYICRKKIDAVASRKGCHSSLWLFCRGGKREKESSTRRPSERKKAFEARRNTKWFLPLS